MPRGPPNSDAIARASLTSLEKASSFLKGAARQATGVSEETVVRFRQTFATRVAK